MKKKGFTLIELLAVIVILGIIAVITTPLIMGVIEDARKNSAIQSVNGLLEAGEQYQIESMLEGDMTSNINLTSDDLEIKGSKPESGTLLISASGNMSIIAKYGDYCIEKKFLDETPSIIESEECEIAQSELEAMDILKSPTFESKTVSENEVTLAYTTEEEQNKIHETVCYYGKTESSMSNKVVADDTNCKLPVEAGYAKVCHISNSGMASCSEPKHLADYLILDGKMMVEFINVNATVIDNDDYMNFNVLSTASGRSGIYTTIPIDLTNYAYVYIDWEGEISSGKGDFDFTLENEIILPSGNLSNNLYAILLSSGNSSIVENLKSKAITSIQVSNYSDERYVTIWRNNSNGEINSKIYNVWFQLSK